MIVVSHDGFNRTPGWRSVIVVPVSTSASQAARGPTVVEIPRGIGGLRKTSVALCHQVTTLDRGKLSEQIGTLPGEHPDQLGLALEATMDLN